jgi:hypothetical protein
VILNSVELPISDPSRQHNWDEVRQVQRRIWLLRAIGKTDEASQLEHVDLPRALATARITAPDVDEQSVLADEAERVANATVLAELLAPLLADRLRSAPANAASSAASAPANASPANTPEPTPAAATPPPRPASAPARPASSTPPSVTDLIDGMLSQNRATSGARA